MTKKTNVVNVKVDSSKHQDKAAMEFAFQDAQTMRIG